MNENEIEHMPDQPGDAVLDLQPFAETLRSEEVEAVMAGYICLDIIPTLVGDVVSLAPGHVIEAGRAILATDGPVSNTGLALHKLGVRTRLMGKVGDDLFGQATRQIVESFSQNLPSELVVAPHEASSYAMIVDLPKAERVVIHAPNCNASFGSEDVNYELLKTVGLFHFGYLPSMERLHQDEGKELTELFQRARACGVTTSLDSSLTGPAGVASRADWRQMLWHALPHVDVFLSSVEDVLMVLRRPLFDKLANKGGNNGLLDLVSPEIISEMAQELLEQGVRIVGLKAGHRGLFLRTNGIELLEHMGRAQPTQLNAWANRELWAPCFKTQVVGTTGAGDAIIAGFLLGLVRGMPPEATLSAACAVGACNVEAADALSGIKSWPETLERIAAGWPRLFLKGKHRKSSLDMPHFGWQWKETTEVWCGPRDASRVHRAVL